jgi:hypothetical protein
MMSTVKRLLESELQGCSDKAGIEFRARQWYVKNRGGPAR